MTYQDMTSLEVQGRLRAEFLGMVSHELRTPLTSIKGSAATLLNSGAELSDAELRQFHRIIDTQADRMRDLLADLLDVAHIETGTLAVNSEPSDVALMVDKAFNIFLSAGGRKNVHFNLPSDLPHVLADKRRIVQVLTNLLANAASHSSESSPVRVTAVREQFQVAISVSDEGRGIQADLLPHLFRRFVRENSEEFGLGGAGLGLAICKGIVEAHGGRIKAESEGPGLGARFIFTLPIAAGGEREAAAGPARPAERSPRERQERLGILVVDDDPHTLRYIHDALSKAGYRPIVTSDPEEAISLMEKEAPRLVLMDLMLPGSNGIDLMEDMLAIAEVPVIFISAYREEQVVAKALDMGAVDYVVKPFSATELTARIRSALRRREASILNEPYRLAGLTIDYAERRVTVAGEPVRLTPLEYRMLAELASNGGRVLTHRHLLRRLWGIRNDSDLRPMRTVIKSLRSKLGDDSKNPTYIFTEPRGGYRMARATTPG